MPSLKDSIALPELNRRRSRIRDRAADGRCRVFRYRFPLIGCFHFLTIWARRTGFASTPPVDFIRRELRLRDDRLRRRVDVKMRLFHVKVHKHVWHCSDLT
jgi:hypothetical protein